MKREFRPLTDEEKREMMRRLMGNVPDMNALLRKADAEEATNEDCEKFASDVVSTMESATKWMIKIRGPVDYEPLRKERERDLDPDEYKIWLETVYASMLRVQAEALAELEAEEAGH